MIFASRPNLLYTNPVYRPLTQDRVFGSGYRVVFTGNEVTSLIVYSADVDIDDVDTSSIYADFTLGIRQQSIRKRGIRYYETDRILTGIQEPITSEHTRRDICNSISVMISL